MDSSQLKIFWKQVLIKVQEFLSESAWQKWIEPIKPISLNKNVLTLGMPTDFHRQWVEERYISQLEDAVFKLSGEHFSIALKVVNDKKKNSRSKSENLVQTTLSINPPDSDTNVETDTKVNTEEAPLPERDLSTLIKRYTFDNFVIGKSNEFAHAAALAVCKAPGKSYNPFFIYGGVGLGKTHLMHAIGNAIAARFPRKNILYVSCEQFTNELINSLRDNKMVEFKQKYRTIDVLLVDDVQFLSGKDSTQEEFFHTFNSLHNLDKQIVLSSDRHPQDVEGIEERLRSRFDWGLVTDIQRPDLETRIAILQKKAMVDNIEVPLNVIKKIAYEVNTNVRDLEGAFNRVTAFASLTNKLIDLSVLDESNRAIDPLAKKMMISLEDIDQAVASYFHLSIEKLHKKTRAANIVRPRQIAMYLCRELTPASLPAIARFFGIRNHTTVLRACEKIKNELQKNQEIKDKILALKALLFAN